MFLKSVLFSFVTAGVVFAGQVQTSRCDGSQQSTLVSQTSQSCVCLNRTLDALANHLDAVKKEFKPGISMNFDVFYKSPSFYLSRFQKRTKACSSGTVSYRCVGLCHTEQGTLAYVNVNFGQVEQVVNVCDEFFATGDSQKLDVVSHEMGRLENIGDSPNFDTDNIYVWDAIVGHLCDEATYKRITAGK